MPHGQTSIILILEIALVTTIWLCTSICVQTNIGGWCDECKLDWPNLAVHIHEHHNPQGPNPEVRQGANKGSSI